MPLWIYLAYLLVNNFALIFVTRYLYKHELCQQLYDKCFGAAQDFSALADNTEDARDKIFTLGKAWGLNEASGIVLGELMKKEKD